MPRLIPDSIKQLLPIEGGELVRESIRKVKVPGRIAFEIGDTKQDDFYPQFKTEHWNNESNFSARLVTKDGAVIEHDGKLAYDDGEKIARFYEKDTGDEDGGFEFDVLLRSRPESKVLTWTLQHKGLTFHYQPALTQEEIDKGASRPENVIGSYAVYHESKKNNQYRTGKAFHIYRPYAEDATGRRFWCDLNIDPVENVMSVTMPEKELDQVVYPLVVDPTFGYTNVGLTKDTTAWSGTSGDGALVGQYPILEPGDIYSISVYGHEPVFLGSPISILAKALIFSDLSGEPDTLLSSSDFATISNGGAPKWHKISITESVTTGDYWIGVAGEATAAAASLYYDSLANEARKDLLYDFTPAVDWDASTDTPYTNRAYSIYANYTVAGANFDISLRNPGAIHNIVMETGGSGPTYTIALDTGSYSLTGNAAALKRGRTLVLESGSYSTTGNAQAVRVGRTITLAVGSYSLTGYQAAVGTGRQLLLSSGSYSLTGNAAALRYSRILPLDSGTYSLTGHDATLFKGRTLVLEYGSYSITGNAAGARVGRRLALAVGSYTTTGFAASLAAGKNLLLSSGSLSSTGNAAALRVGRRITLETGLLTLTGQPVELSYGRRIVLEAGTYATTGNAAELRYGRILPLTTGTYTFTGYAVGLSYADNKVLVGSPGSYTLTGYAATLRLSRRLTLAPAAYLATGNAATLSRSYRVSADVGSYAYLGNPAGVRRQFALPLAPGVYTFTGQPIDLYRGAVIQLENGEYTCVGYDSSLTYQRNGGIAYWDGAEWTIGTLKYWDGAEWQRATLKRWNGTEWSVVQ